MGEQVAARLIKKTTRKSVIYRYGHILVGGEQNEACGKDVLTRTSREVLLYITGFNQ